MTSIGRHAEHVSASGGTLHLFTADDGEHVRFLYAPPNETPVTMGRANPRTWHKLTVNVFRRSEALRGDAASVLDFVLPHAD